jgi:pSer/pThr/pTyr-binding forkhead associated (FHA) protein
MATTINSLLSPLRDGSLNRRELTFNALAGLAGGAAGWIPIELVSHGHTLTEQPSSVELVMSYLVWAIFSGLIGGAILASQRQKLALSAETEKRFIRGFLVCLVLAMPAYYIANGAFSWFLTTGGWGPNHQGSIFMMVCGRIASWFLMGTMLGAGVGIATFELPNVIKGAIGGAIGGFLGGALFDAVSIATGGGLASRLIALALVGLAIGLFIGLVQELTKAAWVTVAQGRLRGRQYRIEGARAAVGRAEESPVGLFGDPEVQMRHAVVERRGADYVIKNLAVQQGTFVNGKRVESVDLHDGDRIGVGGYELIFHLRQSSASAIAQATLAADRPSEALVAARLAGPMAAAVDGPCLVDEAGQRYALRKDAPTRIGRALDNDIVVSHSSVSRHHASIEATGGAFELKDLNSQNGTFVSDRRITAARIADGDAVRLGQAPFIFRA